MMPSTDASGSSSRTARAAPGGAVRPDAGRVPPRSSGSPSGPTSCDGVRIEKRLFLPRSRTRGPEATVFLDGPPGVTLPLRPALHVRPHEALRRDGAAALHRRPHEDRFDLSAGPPHLPTAAVYVRGGATSFAFEPRPAQPHETRRAARRLRFRRARFGRAGASSQSRPAPRPPSSRRSSPGESCSASPRAPRLRARSPARPVEPLPRRDRHRAGSSSLIADQSFFLVLSRGRTIDAAPPAPAATSCVRSCRLPLVHRLGANDDLARGPVLLTPPPRVALDPPHLRELRAERPRPQPVSPGRARGAVHRRTRPLVLPRAERSPRVHIDVVLPSRARCRCFELIVTTRHGDALRPSRRTPRTAMLAQGEAASRSRDGRELATTGS